MVTFLGKWRNQDFSLMPLNGVRTASAAKPAILTYFPKQAIRNRSRGPAAPGTVRGEAGSLHNSL
jgi:hypothetical protein